MSLIKLKRFLCCSGLIVIVIFLQFNPSRVKADTTAESSEANITAVTPDVYEKNIKGVTQIDFYQYLAQKGNRQGKFFLFIGFKECPYCREFSPVLHQFLREANLPVYYLNLESSFTGVPVDDVKIFLNSFNQPFSFEGTPTIALVSHGQIIKDFVGSDTNMQDLRSLITCSQELD